MSFNPCIVSFYMDNIDTNTVKLQSTVVKKFNSANIKHYLIKIDFPHGVGLDYFWALNGIKNERFANLDIKQQLEHDCILFLDIDCIPLSTKAIPHYFEAAQEGRIIGNAQRSNHLQNDQHVFAAPSALCLSADTYKKIGMPCATETMRSDVAEEYTWAAEQAGVKVDLVMPLRYDNSPQRYEWEGDQPPYWTLADGMPVYGMGTTYGTEDTDMFYHNFQIRMDGQQDKFCRKCVTVLSD